MITMCGFTIIDTRLNGTITYNLTPGQTLYTKHYITGNVIPVKIKRISTTNKGTTISVWGTEFIPVKGNENFEEITTYDAWFPLKSLNKTLFLYEEDCKYYYGRK